MYFIKTLSLGFLTALILVGCGEVEPVELGPKEAWKVDNFLDSNQVVLTNSYAFKNGRFTKGAASFLVETKKGTYLCTAKHLLSEAMGISPKIPVSNFNQQLDYWKVYARNNQLFKDTLSVRSIRTNRPDASDIILLQCQSMQGDHLLPLKPRFSKINPNEVLEIIGYEYGDASGNQSLFKVEMDEYDNGTLIVKAKTQFNASGMSGSPVIDASGYVVGVLVGGGNFEGELYLTVEPLRKVKQYLK